MPDTSEIPSRALRPAWTWAAGVALALLIVVAVIALLPGTVWRSLIVHEIKTHTGLDAAIDGEVRVHLLSWNPQLSVAGLRIENAGWARPRPLLTAQRIELTVRLASLLHGEWLFPHISIESPALDLQRDAAGRVNWDFSPDRPRSVTNAALRLPVVQQLRVNQGVLTVSDAVRRLTFDGRIGIVAEQNAPGIGALTVRGTGSLNRKPFDLHMNGEPLLDVDRQHPYQFDAALRAADIKLNSHVIIAHPFDLAALSATFELSGADLADVYYLTGLALPNTPPYRVSGTVARDGAHFRIDDLHGTLGNSDIAGKLALAIDGARPRLTATLSSKQLRLADLAAPLGNKPTAPPQTLGQDGDSRPDSGDPGRLLPDADLQVDRVRGMDADVTYDAASVLTATVPVRKLHLRLKLDDARLEFSPVAFILPQGEFAGSVRIDARGAIPQTDIDMSLRNVELAQFKPKASGTAPLDGELLGRVRLHGSGASVHKAAASASGDLTVVVPHGRMRAVIAELTGIDLSRGIGLFLKKSDATTAIRCGVANFHATGGDFKATSLLMDTSDVLITGEGHVDMNTEALDLSLRGQPKEVRLLRLRAPITLRGSLSKPRIGVNAGKALGQAGGAAALGALLTPLAAVLAFVDRGLAKNADCAALLAQAEQRHDLNPSGH